MDIQPKREDGFGPSNPYTPQDYEQQSYDQYYNRYRRYTEDELNRNYNRRNQTPSSYDRRFPLGGTKGQVPPKFEPKRRFPNSVLDLDCVSASPAVSSNFCLFGE